MAEKFYSFHGNNLLHHKQLVINNLFTADAPRDDGPMGGGGGGGGGGDPHHGFPQTDAPTPKKYEGLQNPNIVPEKSSYLEFYIVFFFQKKKKNYF